MQASSSSGANGLVRYSSAPKLRPRIRSGVLAKAVNSIIGTRENFRSILQTL